jgi:beta-N-acetylhexosaminidase
MPRTLLNYLLLLGLLWLTSVSVYLPTTAQRLDYDMRIEQMTLEQKVGQLFVFTFFGDTVPEAVQPVLERWQPGGFALLPSNIQTPEQITFLTNQIQTIITEAGGVPAFIAVDQEGGTIARLQEGFTRWPVPMLLTATQNEDLAYRFGRAVGTEMRAVGINMNFAPVADVLTNPSNVLLSRRTYGSHPELIAPVVSSVIEGMQDSKVMATAKHFPGHGDTVVDSHIELPVIDHDWWRLAQVEMTPFMASFDADVGAVMVAHIWYPSFDPDSETPASLSQRIVTGLLRDELAYPGIVMTDALDMDAIDRTYSPEEAALRAIMAGNDLVITGAHVSHEAQVRAMQGIVQAVRDGRIDEARINASVRRIFQAKDRFGVIGWRPLEPDFARFRIDSDTHTVMIDEMFKRGITLVRNEGQLVPALGKTVLIHPASRQSLNDKCETFGDFQQLTVARSPSLQDIQFAQDVARDADRVIVITENAITDPQQAALVRALPPEKTIAVALWSPYDIQTYPNVAAYLVTYSSLTQLHEPLCAVLFGAAPAQGTLSVDLSKQLIIAR